MICTSIWNNQVLSITYNELYYPYYLSPFPSQVLEGTI